MITESNTAAPTAAPILKYEYLQVRATVINFTGQTMEVTGSDLSWGKWINSPGNVPANDESSFGSQGRDSSPSGTEGWATWKIGSATIKVTFSCPLHGSNQQSISCTSTDYVVNVSGTGGDVNYLKFTVKPKK
ncbi:MAG: aegerolysin family protein [Acidobacteriota bacterium]